MDGSLFCNKCLESLRHRGPWNQFLRNTHDGGGAGVLLDNLSKKKSQNFFQLLFGKFPENCYLCYAKKIMSYGNTRNP